MTINRMEKRALKKLKYMLMEEVVWVIR
jgi:hypothetical protein